MTTEIAAGTKNKKSIISDMDGVVYRGGSLITGAKDFVKRAQDNGNKLIFMTNNSEQSQLDLVRKLEALGIGGLTEDNFLTAAMATAEFIKTQTKGKTASIFAVGGPGLANELYKAGFTLTEKDPDFVVVGKTNNFNFDMLKKASKFIYAGARFIGTNPDVVDPVENSIEPACGSILAAIEAASGKKPYIIGKPNPIMTIIAKRKLGAHANQTLMIGDRMDTDILTGIESGMISCLVLSGVTTNAMLSRFSYRPDCIFNNIGEIYPDEV